MFKTTNKHLNENLVVHQADSTSLQKALQNVNKYYLLLNRKIPNISHELMFGQSPFWWAYDCCLYSGFYDM